MDDELKKLLDAIRQDNAVGHAETRRHFDVAVEALRGEMQTLAEGVIANTDRIERLESDLKAEFTEVRSMIRLSYTELERRLRTLEDAVSALQSRVERLEESIQ